MAGSLVVWLFNIITSIVGFFGLQLATRTLMAVTAIAATIAVTVALASLMTSLITGLQATLTDNWLVSGAGFFLPWNTSLCVSAYIAARIGKWMHDFALLHVVIASRI